MEQQFSHESASILHALDLGRHTLFIMSDGSIDLLANDEQTPYLADNGISLDGDETYRLSHELRNEVEKSERMGLPAGKRRGEEAHVHSLTSQPVRA